MLTPAGGKRQGGPIFWRLRFACVYARRLAAGSWRVPMVRVLAARPRAVQRACREVAPFMRLTAQWAGNGHARKVGPASLITHARERLLRRSTPALSSLTPVSLILVRADRDHGGVSVNLVRDLAMPG